MVRLVDCRWNQLLPALHAMYSKLERFGFALQGGEVKYYEHPQVQIQQNSLSHTEQKSQEL